MYHNDWFQSMYKVFIRLSLGVAIVVLVLITKSKLFGILSLDLFIRHCLTLTLLAGGERERERERERDGKQFLLLPMVIHNDYIPHLVH